MCHYKKRFILGYIIYRYFIMQVSLLSSSEKKLSDLKKNETLFLKHLLKQLILHKFV